MEASSLLRAPLTVTSPPADGKKLPYADSRARSALSTGGASRRQKDTSYGKAALADTELYKAIVAHRAKVYHLGYVGDYSIDYPENISFIPSGEVLENYRKDYDENMVDGYIYGKAMSFDELIGRMVELQNRIRAIKL